MADELAASKITQNQFPVASRTREVYNAARSQQVQNPAPHQQCFLVLVFFLFSFSFESLAKGRRLACPRARLKKKIQIVKNVEV